MKRNRFAGPYREPAAPLTRRGRLVLTKGGKFLACTLGGIAAIGLLIGLLIVAWPAAAAIAVVGVLTMLVLITNENEDCHPLALWRRAPVEEEDRPRPVGGKR